MNPASNINISYRNDGTELVIRGSHPVDFINVSQTGNVISVNANGNVTTWNVPAAGVFVYGAGGAENITIDASVKTHVTVVDLSGTDVVTDNAGGEVWINASDIFTGYGVVHKIAAFDGGVSMSPGAHLAEPTDEKDTFVADSSLWGTGPKNSDINQGDLGDCYFLAPLAALAMDKPAALEDHAVDLGDGTYAVQFTKGRQTFYERVSNLLSADYNESNGGVWSDVMEKAYAFSRTHADTYESMDGGWPDETFAVLGFNSDTVKISSMTGIALVAVLKADLASGKVVAFCSNSTIPKGITVVTGHVYSLVSVNADGSITLRNPWGVIDEDQDDPATNGMLTLTTAQIEQAFDYFVVTTV